MKPEPCSPEAVAMGCGCVKTETGGVLTFGDCPVHGWFDEVARIMAASKTSHGDCYDFTLPARTSGA